jgi:FlaA1/EpsC-like NDP-sugar epimerase
MIKPVERVLSWYFSRNALPYWGILMLDFAILLMSGLMTCWLFVFRNTEDVDVLILLRTLVMYAVPGFVGARMFHTYSGIVRYSSFVDLTRVFYANFISLIIAHLMHYLVLYYPGGVFYHLGFRHIIMMYAVATLLMWGLRVGVKTLFEITTLDARAIRVLIYGAMEGGVGLAKLIRSQKPARFNVKGFIAHNGNYNTHNRVMGLHVFNATDDIAQIIKRMHIEAVLIATPRVGEFRNDQKLQDQILGAGVKIFMSESAKELSVKDGELKDGLPDNELHLKEVSVEDLLPRDEIRVDMKSVGELLSGHRIMITGAAGSIGSEMVRQIAAYNPEAMMLIDQAETPDHDLMLMMAKRYPKVKSEVVVTSICKQDRMESIFQEFRPDYVFHAAAYKHVPMMEGNPSEAVQNNIYGTKVIADLSVKYGVKKFVMVSTDKAVNPTNVMGCSKRICEIYVQALDKTCKTQFVTTRFGNVLGSNGSVIPLFKEQIQNGGPVTVTDENIVRYFMLIPEACKLVLEAGTKGNGGEIFVFDMGQPVRIADLAKRMIRLSGAKNVEIKYTGLRPGEKLYEEVLNDKEGTKPTFHEKIRIAEVRSYEFAEVSKDIDELIEISTHYDNMATVKKMKEIVPEYKSNNSVYEVLDQQQL